MLWALYSRKTRSGTIFAAWTRSITSLQATDFDLGPLLSQAVAAESDEQEDSEPHDGLNDIDEEWLPNPLNNIDEDWPPQDPWNDVDDLPPPPAAKKRRASPTFDDVVATGPPQKGNHHRRALKRVHKIETDGFTPRASTLREHVQPAQPLHAPSFNASALPTARGAYAAKVEDKAEKYGGKKRHSLAELIGLGFQLVHWNGIAARPLIDNAGCIFAVLTGQPVDSKWRAAVSRAYDTIKMEGLNTQFPAAMRRHQHGLFAAINVGLAYGKGQKIPTWLDNTEYTSVVDRLLRNSDIARLANFASFAFSLWAPRLHRYYVNNNARVRNRLPDLRRPFPNVWTFKHQDVCNLPFGWCAIQSLGTFDATQGRHLVLWDLKLIVEFPPGALILLPSATLTHSNTPVEDGDKRISFTQFTSGGLFRWMDNGRRTDKQLRREDPAEYSRLLAKRELRWEEGLSYFSTVDELLDE
ncbi:hypothetical protein B0H14DRAFT_2559198 [Mycena olivaceomarginata]|nr:hypothetical protein B0H14DRAFT_2559198 [Mycena olivaceomarginata]